MDRHVVNTETDRQEDRTTGIQVVKQTDRQTDKRTGRREGTKPSRLTDRQTGRRTGTQSSRQARGQADKGYGVEITIVPCLPTAPGPQGCQTGEWSD